MSRTNPSQRFKKSYSNNHTETTIPHSAPAPFHIFKPFRGRDGEGAARKAAWEQSLTCQCRSGLPILKRAKRQGKWLAWCKKCDPSAFPTGAKVK